MPCHQQRKSHTQTDISDTNAGKAPLPYEPRLASDKTHDANCRHQPMTRIDLRTFCNVRETLTASDSDILYHSERMHASSSSSALPSHAPSHTNRTPNANASPTLANRHLHPSEAHAQTHRSAGRIPQPCHATSNANHTQTDISATNAGKAPLP